MSFKSEEIKAMPDKPCQPHHLSFPFRSFGKNAPVNRSFQVSWFNRFPWIHYELDQDVVYCFVCCKAVKEGKIRLTGMTEASFLVKGFILENLCNYFCAILCFVNFKKIRVGGGGGVGCGRTTNNELAPALHLLYVNKWHASITYIRIFL